MVDETKPARIVVELAGAEAGHGVTRVQPLDFRLEEVREDTDRHTFGQVLGIKGYPDILQERGQLNRVSTVEAIHRGAEPTAALDVLRNPPRVTRGNEPRGVVQPIHPVVRDGAELLYHGVDWLEPRFGGPQRSERRDGQRLDVYGAGMRDEIHRLVAAPARIERDNRFP